MNWSVVLLVGYIAWILYQDGTNLVIAIAAGLMLVVSILLHELGHAFQARADGMETDGITLWLFGGVARFSGNFPSAGAEFRIAVAGPLVSLALALGFGGALFIALPDSIEGAVRYLALLNAALLIFNLIPALPLDGGRMLRAALWGKTGSFTKGTRLAGVVSTILSGAMIAVGAWLFLNGNQFGGIWLAIIGLFLMQSAKSENRAMIAQEAFDGITAEDAMFRLSGVAPARQDMTIAQMLRATAGAGNAPGFPVVDDRGQFLGVVSMSVVGALTPDRWETTTVSEVMISGADVVVVAPADELLPVARAIRGNGIAVVSNGINTLGVVSMREVSGALDARGTGVAPTGGEA